MKHNKVEPQSRTERAKRDKKRNILSWIYCIAIAVVVAILLRLFVLEFYLVKGPSMEPELVEDNRVFVEKVSKYFTLPSRNDIVIVHPEGIEESFIKRVIGLPGDTVEIVDGYLYLNGARFEDDVYKQKMSYDMAAVTVPEDHIFVMGDNRDVSLDSRDPSIGCIPRDKIIGVVKFKIG